MTAELIEMTPSLASSGSRVRRILVLACNRRGISRTARPLRTRGCSVQTCNDSEAASAYLGAQPFELLVVERDEEDTSALLFLRRLRENGHTTPCVLVTSYDAPALAAAINDGHVTRVVPANAEIGTILDEILAATATEPEPPDLKALRGRCRMLEDKINRLVREGIQREGASRLLHDLLVEVGAATDVKDIAGRCLARVVTMLNLDMAFIVIAEGDPKQEAQFFSFGCPRAVRGQLRELAWHELAVAVEENEEPLALTGLLAEAASARLTRLMHVEAVNALVVFPLRAHGTTFGFLGLGDRHQERRPNGSTPWEPLRPVAKQIAIAIENARLVDASTEAEALATGVLQHLLSTVLVCDPSGQIVHGFDAKQGLFAGRAVRGTKLLELLPAAEAEVLAKNVTDVAHGADPVYLRAWRLALSSGERLLNISIASLPSHNVIVIIDDITRRESIAGDLRRARALTSSLFANAPAGVLFLSQSGEIIDINHTACALFCRTRKELLGESLAERFPDLWQAATRATGGEPGEVTFRVAGSEYATASFSTTRLGRGGRPAGILLQIQDMGEIQALREELRRKDNLALMGQMVSFIAHEIKNPLFGISSAAQVIARESEGDEADRLASAMLSEIERLSQLLEELLVFGSKRAIEKVAGDPTALCQEIVALHRDALRERAILLEAELTPPARELLFDPARLRQVIVNLVANAVDAAEPGGRVYITSQPHDDGYLIEVANTGPPIPEEEQARIFDLFYSTKPNGSGLGLPICKKIVEDHDGSIEVRSGPAPGTRFRVLLPAAPGARPGDGHGDT